MPRGKHKSTPRSAGTSSQDGGVGRHTVPPHTTNRRITTIKKKKTELTENRTIWKSDNQGVKEATFIQTGRGGGDGQPGGEDLQQGSGWWSSPTFMCR